MPEPGRPVLGDSAVGNLAAATALLARDRGGPPIAAQLLVYPCLSRQADLPSRQSGGRGETLTPAAMDWFWQLYLARPKDATNPNAVPLLAPDLAGLPPATVVVAGLDPLRDQGEAYAVRLREAGVPVDVLRYPHLVHGFLWMAGELQAGRRLIAELGEILRWTGAR